MASRFGDYVRDQTRGHVMFWLFNTLIILGLFVSSVVFGLPLAIQIVFGLTFLVDMRMLYLSEECDE